MTATTMFLPQQSADSFESTPSPMRRLETSLTVSREIILTLQGIREGHDFLPSPPPLNISAMKPKSLASLLATLRSKL